MGHRKKRKAVEPFKPAKTLEERLKQAFEDFSPLEVPPELGITKACCPHCFIHGPTRVMRADGSP